MILKTLRTYFNSELLGYYPDTEITSFFCILSEHILKLKRIDIALNLYQVVSGKKYDKFQVAVERLKKYEPIQYITGETEFYGLPFKVNNDVLIPRPETEELVSLVLKNIKNQKENSKTYSILDIGTGSGCIAISLAKNLSNAKVYALDVCTEALQVAKQNAKLNEVDITFIKADVLNESSWNLEFKDLKFDGIVSNPPYVRHSEKAEIKSNVLDNEPHLALFVEDDDALQFYKAIVQFAVNNLSKNGLLFFEINEYLGDEMNQLLQEHNFSNIELKKDMFGKDRMIKARA